MPSFNSWTVFCAGHLGNKFMVCKIENVVPVSWGTGAHVCLSTSLVLTFPWWLFCFSSTEWSPYFGELIFPSSSLIALYLKQYKQTFSLYCIGSKKFKHLPPNEQCGERLNSKSRGLGLTIPQICDRVNSISRAWTGNVVQFLLYIDWNLRFLSVLGSLGVILSVYLIISIYLSIHPPVYPSMYVTMLLYKIYVLGPVFDSCGSEVSWDPCIPY